ncbi:MAG: FKBP-type peptidyl-prolyl cis-trans isomerase [Prevotella sp.]|nr:FKBP-type peptidyl-prolyl cis-trans isomerase [Prevotella sp.]MBQ9187492.1 FKBP-type peptidyl-prolyl cis-trans isomerase [Prevotella sp.]
METTRNKIKGWVKVLPFYLFTLLPLFTSCKEEDDTIEEYPNWQATNDAYFNALVAETQARIAGGDTQWALIPGYSKPDKGHTYAPTDYIVVQKLESSANTTSPIGQDTVEVHYVGKLLPSANKYKEDGYEFERTFSGVYDPDIATPTKLALNSSTLVGFVTALLHMHRDDHWRVFIPYQLGYNTSANGSIPAYSTLIFDLRLQDFWQKEEGDRK